LIFLNHPRPSGPEIEKTKERGEKRRRKKKEEKGDELSFFGCPTSDRFQARRGRGKGTKFSHRGLRPVS